MKKRILSLLLAVCLCGGLLSACAGDQGNNSSQSLESTASSQISAGTSDMIQSEVSVQKPSSSGFSGVTNNSSKGSNTSGGKLPGSQVSSNKASSVNPPNSSVNSTVNKKPRKKGEPIMVENNIHMDKVKTEGFTLPATTKESEKDYKMPLLLVDGCVLQAYKACRLWGEFSSDGGMAVQVTRNSDGKSNVFYGEVKNGKFELYIYMAEYGGPYTVTFIAENGKTYTLKDVLFGEVFIGGGQSNMGWGMYQCYDGTTDKLLYQDIIDNSKDNWLRLAGVWPVKSDTKVDSLSSMRSWASADPTSVKGYSATAYFFGRRMRKLAPDIPIGLVTSCMGATGVEQWMEGGEYNNAMIHPIRNLTARGVIWYQCEGDPENYASRLAKMINDWRSQFRDPELLWAAVQLPRYKGEEVWYKCREEVKKVVDLVKLYTYCVTIDTGLYPENKAEGDALNDDGIHPYEKEPVGIRLADAMMGAFTDEPGLWTAPYATEAKLDKDGNIVVTFANVGGGLMLQGQGGFEVADSYGYFHDAEPIRCSNNQVVLKCKYVSDPTKVRYGYKNSGEFSLMPLNCAESVCVYNTHAGSGKKAYPAEQFTFSIKK